MLTAYYKYLTSLWSQFDQKQPVHWCRLCREYSWLCRTERTSQQVPPERVAQITGILARHRYSAREYVTSQPSVIRLGVALEKLGRSEGGNLLSASPGRCLPTLGVAYELVVLHGLSRPQGVSTGISSTLLESHSPETKMARLMVWSVGILPDLGMGLETPGKIQTLQNNV